MEALKIWIFKDGLQIVKYGITGVFGGVIQVLFLYIFVDKFGIWYLYAVVPAYLVTLIIVFLIQKYWTFQDYSTDRFRRQSLSYSLIALGSLFLNVFLMYLLVNIFDIWYVTAQIIIVGLVGVASFFMNKNLTFENRVI